MWAGKGYSLGCEEELKPLHRLLVSLLPRMFLRWEYHSETFPN